MSAFLIANIAPMMFGVLVLLLLIGYPVAFSLAANGLLFGLLAIDLGLLKPEEKLGNYDELGTDEFVK